MPSPEQTWGPEEYARAVVVLARLSESPTLLPRFGSDRSGDVFERFVSPDNLSILTAESESAETRVGIALDIQGAARDFLLAYAAPSSDNVLFDDELSELMGFLLRVSVDGADCLEEFRETLPADDPKRDVRQQGYERMQLGMSQVVAGALSSLGERRLYREPARLRLAQHLSAQVPRLALHLTELQRVEIVRSLASFIEQEPVLRIREILAETMTGLPR